jgi:hypothetical protein
MTVIVPKPRTCGKEACTVSACFCCSPPVPWANDERNPASHDAPADKPKGS